MTAISGSRVGTARMSVRGRRRLAGRRPLEWLALLASPAVVFFVVRARPMAVADSIDASFYTAYAQHGVDLIQRFGAGHYYWVRLGFILPARACYLAFGALGGFYVFRYLLALLAVVPAYLLFRTLHGRGAGAVVVVAILASPVVLATWGSDYPDSAALSYLIAGSVLLVMPAATRWRRLGLVTASGVVFTLAVHCQVVDVPLIAAAVGGYLLVYLRRRSVRPVLVELLVLAGCAVVVTGVLAGIAGLWLGHADILSPTWRDFLVTRRPSQLQFWHSANWRWVLTVPYVLVPPAVTLAWCALRLRRHGVPREELAVGIGTGLGVAAYIWMQFAGSVATLEYHIYSSMLWAGVCLTTAFLVVAVSGRLLARSATAAVPALIVLAVAVGWGLAHPGVHFTLAPLGLLVAAALVVIGARGAVAGEHRGLAALAVTGIVVGDLFLTVVPATQPKLPGTTGLPHGKYDTILGHPHTITVDQYAVASRLHTVVPPATGPGQRPLGWWPPGQSPIINMVSAQYLWRHLDTDMPRLTRVQARSIAVTAPPQMLFFSLTGREFPAALTAVRQVGDRPRVLRRATLRSGSVTVHVWVVALERFVRR